MSQFEVETTEHRVLVRCPGNINSGTIKEFAPAFTQIVRSGPTLIVFDWTRTQQVAPGFFRPIVLARQALLRAGRKLASFGMSPEVLDFLKRHGVETVFNPMRSLAEIEASHQKPATEAKLDARFMNAFVTATVTSLEMQASLKAVPGKPVVLKRGENKQALAIDVAGVISLNSPLLTGSLALCFPSRVLCAVYSKMLGESVAILSEEVIDSAGEMTNIIFGQAKRILNDELGHQMDKAIPTILHGHQLQVHDFGQGVTVVIVFETEVGPFYLKANVLPQSKK